MTRHPQHTHHQHDAHDHGSHDHGAHNHGSPADEAAMAEVLELDASLAGGYADEAAAWASRLADGPVRAAVDLGAGTGVVTLALAKRFPEAMLTAVDLSPRMLSRLRAAMEGAGAGERLRTVEADLDAGWAGVPELADGGADLAWASSSLHHVQDPDQVLRRVLETLRPGGLLLVLELDELPRFLGGAGDGLAELEERCHREMDRLGWNAHPDWSDALIGAGFRLEGQQTLAAEAGGASGPQPPELGRFARLFLTRMRAALEPGAASGGGSLAAADLRILDRLLGEGAGSLERLPGLSVSTRRTVWAARRPA